MNSHRHIYDQKDKIDAVFNESDLHKYQSMQEFPV